MFRVDDALEAWLAPNEHGARHPLCWSGVAPAPLSMLGDVAWPATGSMGEVAGDPALVAAVARAEGVPADEVVLTAGAGEADALAMLVVAGSGAAVVERPTYPPLREFARRAAADVLRVDRAARDAWRLDPAAVAARLDPGARLVVVASPHNPTGAVLPERDLVRLAEACDEVGAWLLVDEVFRRLADAPGRSARTLHPRILAAGSLTKAEGLGGLRFGWFLGPPEVAREVLALKLATSGSVPPVVQALASGALARRADLLARAKAFRAANLARLDEDLAVAPGWVRPEAGVATLVPVDGDDEAFARDALREDGVLVVPGRHFEAPGSVRVGFGIEPARFAEGWALLRARL